MLKLPLKYLVSLLGLILLPSCGLSLGPQVERQTVFVKTVDVHGNPVTVGRIAENATLKIVVKKDDGTEYTTEQDLGGWGVVNPSAMQTKEEKPK